MRWSWLTACAILVAATAMAGSSEQWLHPKRHFRVANPASLTPEQAESVYRRILDRMRSGYALSHVPAASSYTRWRRFNRYPYRSAAHGERYVNNYGNEKAKAYGKFEEAGPMPPGSVIAKDSFTVTRDGGVYSGPLFLMEKLEPGSDPETRDWRYVMIMPDGSLFGDTRDETRESVIFCASCHNTAPDGDGLFFMPEDVRLKPLLELR